MAQAGRDAMVGGGAEPASRPELSRQQGRVVRILTNAISAQDDYTELHQQRVNGYALRIGNWLGLAAAERQAIHIASLLHDLGKLGLPEQILLKPGPLSPGEANLLRQHSSVGARILAECDGCAEAAVLVLHHHERFDGRRGGEFPGYPHGLRGDQIPLGSRIIAVADAFDAMTSDRPYRRARTAEAAVAILRHECGRQFDPRVVEAFLGGLASARKDSRAHREDTP